MEVDPLWLDDVRVPEPEPNITFLGYFVRPLHLFTGVSKTTRMSNPRAFDFGTENIIVPVADKTNHLHSVVITQVMRIKHDSIPEFAKLYGDALRGTTAADGTRPGDRVIASMEYQKGTVPVRLRSLALAVQIAHKNVTNGVLADAEIQSAIEKMPLIIVNWIVSYGQNTFGEYAKMCTDTFEPNWMHAVLGDVHANFAADDATDNHLPFHTAKYHLRHTESPAVPGDNITGLPRCLFANVYMHNSATDSTLETVTRDADANMAIGPGRSPHLHVSMTEPLTRFFQRLFLDDHKSSRMTRALRSASDPTTSTLTLSSILPFMPYNLTAHVDELGLAYTRTLDYQPAAPIPGDDECPVLVHWDPIGGARLSDCSIVAYEGPSDKLRLSTLSALMLLQYELTICEGTYRI